MSFLKKAYYRAAAAIPDEWLYRRNPIPILLPYHHLVSDEPVPHVRHLYPYKKVSQFKEDLDYLLRHFRVVDPGELALSVREGRELAPGGFLLSFDDGLRECYDTVAPILEAKGVPAVFFLNPAFLNNRALFYRSKISLVIEVLENRHPGGTLDAEICKTLRIPDSGREAIRDTILEIQYPDRLLADKLGALCGISFDEYLIVNKPYLLESQVSALAAKGFLFGGHSMDHPNFRWLSLEEQLEQTWNSCDAVRDLTGTPYAVFSFPHEDAGVGQGFFEQADRRSPRIDLFFGTQNQKSESGNRVLHRFNAERPAYPFPGLVKGMLLYHRKFREVNRKGYR
jgi:peptidoglycan/xylan/chitin deacetylase (PgdA/CDA1 family)